MTYEEARAFIDDTARYGAVLGLASVTELVRRLGNPQDDLKFVHIAGTNGKGSTLAYISTILKEAGYRVGRYISPTIFDYRERIQVDGEYITREGLARLTEGWWRMDSLILRPSRWRRRSPFCGSGTSAVISWCWSAAWAV